VVVVVVVVDMVALVRGHRLHARRQFALTMLSVSHSPCPMRRMQSLDTNTSRHAARNMPLSTEQGL
jgi:hypothetical protein